MALFQTLIDAMFVATPLQTLLLFMIVLLAGIARGAIGFGFSAIVVAASSFWLPMQAVVCLVVVLEIAASLVMFTSIRSDVRVDFLLPLTLGMLLLVPLGLALLKYLPPYLTQALITVFLGAVCYIALSGTRFIATPGRGHLLAVGMLSGVMNGLCAMGGLVIATFLAGSGVSVAGLRATMAIYFLLAEIAFVINALISDIYTLPVLWTSLVMLLPMFIGVQLGSRLFNSLPEQTLKQAIMLALVGLSGIGLLKLWIT